MDLGGERRQEEVVREMKNGVDEGIKEWQRKEKREKGGIRSGNRTGRREGEVILRQVGVDAMGLGEGISETRRTKL